MLEGEEKRRWLRGCAVGQARDVGVDVFVPKRMGLFSVILIRIKRLLNILCISVSYYPMRDTCFAVRDLNVLRRLRGNKKV